MLLFAEGFEIEGLWFSADLIAEWS